jgi:hypothetical protein
MLAIIGGYTIEKHSLKPKSPVKMIAMLYTVSGAQVEAARQQAILTN